MSAFNCSTWRLIRPATLLDERCLALKTGPGNSHELAGTARRWRVPASSTVKKKRGMVVGPFKFGRARQLPTRRRGAWWAFGVQTALLGRLFRRWDETVREVAVRGLADGALREVASQKR